MTDNITLRGVVATPPKSLQTASGLSIVTFRLASSQRRFDRSRNTWVDAETNWYSVTAFRQLADNVASSLGKGDRVLVSGRLRVRAWENGERSGTNVEVDAESIGPDLLFGTSTFTRVAGRSGDSDSRETGREAETEVVGATSSTSATENEFVAADGWASPGTTGSDQAATAAAAADTPRDPDAARSPLVGERELVGAAVSSAPAWDPTRDEAPF